MGEPITARERQMLSALWKAWTELNEIRARDGIPWTHMRTRSSVDEGYFSSVVDECEAAMTAVTGRPAEPWMPKEATP